MSNFSVKLSIEVYPDGEIIVFNNDETLIHLTAKQSIDMMVKNARAADWLSITDMTVYAHKIKERAMKEAGK